MTPAKEVPFVTTKVKAEKQNSVKGRSAGTWEGQRQCKEELFLKTKIDISFLILLLERKIQGSVFSVISYDIKRILSWQFRNEIAYERASPVPAASSMASSVANMHSSTWAEQDCFRN